MVKYLRLVHSVALTIMAYHKPSLKSFIARALKYVMMSPFLRDFCMHNQIYEGIYSVLAQLIIAHVFKVLTLYVHCTAPGF